jgi:1,4-alpha-glucan branching enzyme
MWSWDHEPSGFSWIDCNDNMNSVLTYIRRGPNGYLVCILNFTPLVRQGYRVGVPEQGEYRELINSDSVHYGGSGVGNGGVVVTSAGSQHGYDQHVALVLPPLACLILRKN